MPHFLIHKGEKLIAAIDAKDEKAALAELRRVFPPSSKWARSLLTITESRKRGLDVAVDLGKKKPKRSRPA